MTDIQIPDPNSLLDLIPNPQGLPTNKYVEQLWGGIQEMQKIYDQLLYTKGKEDLYIFNKYILEVEKGKQALAPFHREICDFITDNKHKKKLLLVPRSHLKSTLITIGYSTQRIAIDTNTRVLIFNAVWQMAVDFLSEIKKHLTENETLINLFGNIAEEPLEWSQDRIVLKRSHTNIKEPTVQAAGILTSLVGGHYDLIIIDDPVNRENVSTRDQIEKVILKYKDVVDLLEPDGQLIILGTRWAEGELYGWIMDPENEVRKSFEIMVKKAYTGDLVNNQNLQLLWPDKFDRKELMTRLGDKGWYEFSAQYLNNPVPPEDADFKREWFQYYEIDDYRHAFMKNIMTIDPAISEKKEADFTAMTVGGIDTFSNIFIKDLYRKKVNAGQMIEDIFNLYNAWHPQMIVIETITFQRVLSYILQQEMRRRGVYLPIYEIKHQDKSKEMRIKGLQPIYMNHKIFHRKEHPLTKFLEDELLTFPRGIHDDMIDSESMLVDFLTPPKQKTNRFHHRYLY